MEFVLLEVTFNRKFCKFGLNCLFPLTRLIAYTTSHKPWLVPSFGSATLRKY